MNQPPEPAKLHWDIFCRVIDNFGDIGVCWRLCVQLAQRGQTVRLWVDDASALAWMAPGGAPGVQVLTWTTPFDDHGQAPGEVLVEAFGCEIDPAYVAIYARALQHSGQPCRWINLEYLSAEPYVARCHRLPSPVMSGPGKGLTKHFFYPGFTADTGGLLREPDLLARQARFDRAAWLAGQGIAWQGQRLVSLFCYEPAGLPALLQALAADPQPTLLLVTAGRASQAVQQAWPALQSNQADQVAQVLPGNAGVSGAAAPGTRLTLQHLPTLTQPDFDHLLWSCELNFVRGEDSLVRALWAGRPFIWQIYPQHDDAHHAKLAAFLDWLRAPPDLRQAHARWNGLPGQPAGPASTPLITGAQLRQWQGTVTQARQCLLAQADLVSQLLGFVSKTH